MKISRFPTSTFALGALLALTCLALTPGAEARERAAKAPKAKAARPVPPQVAQALNANIVIQEKTSTFSAQDINRDPFWPVGWKPGMAKVEEAPAQVFRPQDVFRISSIMLGPPDLVVINGKRYETGGVIPVAFGAKTLQCKILRIRDGAVDMALGNQQFSVNKAVYNPDRAK